MSENQSPPVFIWRRPQTFLAVAVAAATTPGAFFAQMPRQGGLLPPLAFFLMAMLPPTLVNSLLKWSQGPVAMLIFFFTTLLKSLLIALAFAFVLYGVCRLVFKSDLDFSDVARIVCYSSGVRILELLPPLLAPHLLSPQTVFLLVIIVFLLVCYLVWVGLQAAGGMSRYPALWALLLSFVAILSVWFWVNHLSGTSPLPTPPPGSGAPQTPSPSQP